MPTVVASASRYEIPLLGVRYRAGKYRSAGCAFPGVLIWSDEYASLREIRPEEHFGPKVLDLGYKLGLIDSLAYWRRRGSSRCLLA